MFRLLMAQTVLYFIFVPGPPPPLAPSPVEVAYESLNEAAAYALKEVYAMSPYYEYSGNILRRDDGQFVVVAPDTDYSGERSSTDSDPASYKWPIVAGYHTHPCLPFSHVPGEFSPQDLRWARVTAKIEYMADLCTGNVHMYDPTKPKVVDAVIGQIPVSGVALEREKDVKLDTGEDND